MKTCPKCGCYQPNDWTTCPACEIFLAVEELPKEEKKVTVEETKLGEPDYTAFFTGVPAFRFDDSCFRYHIYGTAQWKTFMNTLAFAIGNYPSFRFFTYYEVKSEFKVFNYVEKQLMIEALEDLAEMGIIDKYHGGFNDRYRRKPRNKEEEKDRKKYWVRKYKYYVYKD